MKRIIVFAVDTAVGKDFCAIYNEDVDAILKVHASIDEWARYIFAGCKHVLVKYSLVVDYIRIDYYF